MKFSWAIFPAIALLTAIACATSQAAEATQPHVPRGKHLLRYKFAMGETLRYEVKHASNNRTTIDGTTQQVESRSDSVKAWKVTDVLPNGEMEFIHLVEWVKMSNQTPDQADAAYDSRTGERPPRGFEQAAQAVGVPISLVRIAPNGEVTFREEKHPQPKAREDMPITLELPKQPIRVGEKWSHAYDVPVDRKSGAKMQVRTRRVCTLKQVKNGVATIHVDYQVLTPVDPVVRSRLLERLTEGTVRFDIERGRILSQEHEVDKRVLGFSGKASSTHYVSRVNEKLLEGAAAAAEVQTASAAQAASNEPAGPRLTAPLRAR